MTTSDLFDDNPGALSCETQLRQFGGRRGFSGRIATVRCHEDNVLVRARVSEPGEGRVLVVDGGGSFGCALLGDNIAELAVSNGWAGIVVNGCVRDVLALAQLPIGIKALGTNPRPSGKTGAGESDVTVTFGGAEFAPGAMLHADDDGVIVLAP
jgi:regulator of ribonuclease activity A